MFLRNFCEFVRSLPSDQHLAGTLLLFPHVPYIYYMQSVVDEAGVWGQGSVLEFATRW